MSGAIAAGNRHSAEAGAWALGEGGTCVDAALAATFAAFVTEGPLTGPAGGGFVLLAEPGRSRWSSTASSPSRRRRSARWTRSRSTSRTRRPRSSTSARRPSRCPACCRASRRPTSVAADCPGPRCSSRRSSSRAGRSRRPTAQAFLHEILAPILQREDGGRRIYGRVGVIDAADLVPTLMLLRDAGPEAVAMLLPDLAADLDALPSSRSASRWRKPSRGDGRLTTPAPSLGGAVVQTGLAALDPARRDARLARTRRALAAALWRRRTAAPARIRPTGTTHVSVVDCGRRGGRRLVDARLGVGCLPERLPAQQHAGRARRDRARRPRAGDAAAEHDDPDARPRRRRATRGSSPGARAPCASRARSSRSSQAWSATGTPSPRRSHGPPARRRRDRAHVEGGWSEVVAAGLADDGYDVRAWADRNLFFGGVSAVERRPNGLLGAAGDPRRGGHGVVAR